MELVFIAWIENNVKCGTRVENLKTSSFRGSGDLQCVELSTLTFSIRSLGKLDSY